MKKKVWNVLLTGMCISGILAGCGSNTEVSDVSESVLAESTSEETSSESEVSEDTEEAENTEDTEEADAADADTEAEAEMNEETAKADSSQDTVVIAEAETEPFVPDYTNYHEVLDIQYASGENSDYNVYTLTDTNADGILELVLEMGGREDAESYVDIYTLTADGVQLLETQSWPSDLLTNADWVLTIDDTNYERQLS